MHFLLLVMQLVLDRLIPTWRDSLQLAARADGRLEHVPASSLWNYLFSRKERNRPRLARTALWAPSRSHRGTPSPKVPSHGSDWSC